MHDSLFLITVSCSSNALQNAYINPKAAAHVAVRPSVLVTVKF